MKRALCTVLIAALVSGCTSAMSVYEPKLVARGELTLRYDDGVQIYAGRNLLADSPEYTGLAHYVRCVPKALEHAEAAESDGQAAIGTGVAGTIIGISGLGGLAGLAYINSDEDDDKVKMYALLGSGVVVGLLGMSMALISRGLKNSANGHAVDAMNYYNDAVGYYGGNCDRKRLKKRDIVVPAALPTPPASPDMAAPVEPPAPPPADPVDPGVDAPNPDGPQPAPAPDEGLRDIEDVVQPR